MSPSTSLRPDQLSMVPFVPAKRTKRRAWQACNQCRNRKVRCDSVVQSPSPCTNCRLDGVVCKVEGCKRRKKHDTQANGQDVDQRTATAPLLPPISQAITGPNKSPPWEAPITGADESLLVHGESTPFSEDSVLQAPLPTNGLDGRSRLETSLPTYIKPLSADLDAEDLLYLQKCGCFSFPPRELVSVILRRYTMFVHPLVPVLDLDEFIGIVQETIPKKVSLLLYHTVMCAGLAAVDREMIFQFTESSKAAARRKLYIKAKIMFDLEAETDRLVLCQAAILLISWANSKHYKDAFYWVGHAISSAHSMKLPQAESHTSLPNHVRMLRSRIWWTLVIREADVCLTMGRPPRIWPHGMPLLRQESFVNSARTTDYSCLPDVGKFRRDHWVQHRLELAFIEKAKLALIIYRILRLPRPDPEVPNARANREARIWLLEAELKDWRLRLPRDMTSLDPALNLFDDAKRSLHLNISVVNLTDRMAIVILHKSQVSISEWITEPHDEDCCDDDETPVETLAHIKSMRQAAADITTIHKTLHDQGLTPVIPTIGVATVCAAVYVHLLDARSTTATTRAASLKQLYVCLDVLRELGQINDTAQDVTRLVQAAVQAARDGYPLFTNGQKQQNASSVGFGECGEETESDGQLPCSTHSYMEGVVVHAHQPEKRSTLPPTEPADDFDPTSQYLFSGMESLFDFDMCGTPISLPSEAWA